MRKLLLLLLGALLIGGLASCGGDDDGESPVIVAMELQYPPFEMSDTDGNPAGVSVEIAKALGEYLKRPVQIENTAWTGLIPSLQTGKVDLILSSMTITEERAKVVDFSDPYIQSGLALLLGADSPAQDFSDLNTVGRVIAVKSGTIGANLANAELTNAEIRVFEEVSACVLEVAQGKADAFIYDPLTIFENYKKHMDTTKMNLSAIPGSEGFWGIAVKKDNKELLDGVNAFIKDFKAKDGFNKAAAPYLGDIMEVFEKDNIPFFFDF